MWNSFMMDNTGSKSKKKPVLPNKPSLRPSHLENKTFYSFKDVLNIVKVRAIGLSVSELLHYGARNVVEFFIRVPETVLVEDIHRGFIPATFFHPSCLTLHHTDCLKLDLDHNATIYQSKFVTAYELAYPDLRPYAHTMSWAVGNLYPESNWMTYVDGDVKEIPVSIKSLFVTRTKLYQFIELLKKEEANRVSPGKQLISQSSFNLADDVDARRFFQQIDEGQSSVSGEKKINLASNSIESLGDIPTLNQLVNVQDADSTEGKLNQSIDSPLSSNNSTHHNHTESNPTESLFETKKSVRHFDNFPVEKAHASEHENISELPSEQNDLLGFYSMNEVIVLLGMGRSTINEKTKSTHVRYDPSFPRKCPLGKRRKGFRKSEIHAWMDSR